MALGSDAGEVRDIQKKAHKKQYKVPDSLENHIKIQILLHFMQCLIFNLSAIFVILGVDFRSCQQKVLR